MTSQAFLGGWLGREVREVGGWVAERSERGRRTRLEKGRSRSLPDALHLEPQKAGAGRSPIHGTS